jgi:hypothetical protein
VAKGAVFSSAHIAMRNFLQPYVKEKKLSSPVAEVIAGGVGGGFQGLVLSPLLLLKTRVMTDPIFRGNMSMWQTTVSSTKVGMNVIRREGVLALMKGSMMFSAKRVADWSTRYMFAEGFEHMVLARHPDQKLSTTEKALCSFMGGAASTLATIPMDVMVAQIQQASKAGQKVSAIDAFRTQMKEGGIGAVLSFSTRGLIARVAHVSLTTGKMNNLVWITYSRTDQFNSCHEDGYGMGLQPLQQLRQQALRGVGFMPASRNRGSWLL